MYKSVNLITFILFYCIVGLIDLNIINHFKL
jgi:hypothetical protein